MAITSAVYGNFLTNLGTAVFNLPTGTLKVALVGSSYTPDIDHHTYYSDLAGEVTGGGYTAGGQPLTSVTWTYDTTTHQATLYAAPIGFDTLTATFRYAVVYQSTGTAATSALIGYLDYGATQTVTAANFIINFSAGVLRLTRG